jgi:hypothetical protein
MAMNDLVYKGIAGKVFDPNLNTMRMKGNID